jgi:phosphoglycerate kinase
MAPAAQRLSQLMGLPVSSASDCLGPEVESQVIELEEGGILVLENLRFHPGEEENDAGFAQKLASLADIYVDDTFSTAHRVHASIVGVAKYLPAVAGFLMDKELRVMEKLLHDPERPWACLIGGGKVSDKIELLQNMLKRVDSLLVGGGMAAVFLKAQGYEVGQSLVEDDKLDLATHLLQEAKDSKVPFLLPVDAVVAGEIKAGVSTQVVPTNDIPVGSHIVDIGPRSIRVFQDELAKCRTIMWNGPVGIYEIPQFAGGTHAIASFLSTVDATTVVGGGSSAEVVQEMGLADKMTHVSTGGGATLRFLEGVALPGVEVLLDTE